MSRNFMDIFVLMEDTLRRIKNIVIQGHYVRDYTYFYFSQLIPYNVTTKFISMDGVLSEHFTNKNIDGILGLAPYSSPLT